MATGSVDLGLRGLRDVEVIGSGGSAVVYRAVREVPGRFAMQETVAVKVLRSSWDSTARRRFEREQRVMDRLSDTAGFVPILETGETDDGSPYIVMPFYDGGSLQERVARSGPIEWPRAVRLVEEVATTLQQAHELGVFHRDIKPANILLTESGRPHVADFGISLIAEDAAAKATSTAAFTPAYSPPESFTEGLRPVAATDIYGLAATFWAILAGHAPFKQPGERPTAATVFGRVAMHQVGDLRDHVPSPICRFIERAMAKLPDERPATMSDFVTELQEAREDAYRGVEAARLEVKPLVDAVPVDAADAPWMMSDAGIAEGADVGGAGDAVRVGAEPTATELDVATLDAVEPDVAELDVIDLDAVEPDVAELGVIDLDAVEPDVVELGAIDLNAVELGAVEPDAARLDVAEADTADGDEDGAVRQDADPEHADTDNSIVTIGVLPDETVTTAGAPVSPAETPAAGGWLVKVAAVAVSTVLLLLLVWWLLGGGTTAEGSAGDRFGDVGDAGIVALGD